MSFSIPGYILIRSDRCVDSLSRGGGTALYINCNFHCSCIFNTFSDNLFSNSLLDVSGVLISVNHSRLAILSVYRPPSCPITSLQNLELFLTDVACHVDRILCLGDFNVNFNNTSNSDLRYIHSIMSILSLKQIIAEPTRITQTSSTLLDLILVSRDIDVVSTGVYDISHISDHCLIYALFDIPKSRMRQRYVLSRELKSIPIERFRIAA